MFEYDQDAVDSLLANDNNFRRLFDKHNRIKEQVGEVKNKAASVDEVELEQLKKEKLQLKDQMAGIIRNYRQVHAH